MWLYFVEKDTLGSEDVKIFAEEHSEKKCVGMDALAAMRNLRVDNWDKFTAIDRHIIANYVPEVSSRMKNKENANEMRNLSKAF